SNVSIQQNSFTLSKPSHSYPYAAASQALPVSSRQPFQLFQRVSWILLLNWLLPVKPASCCEVLVVSKNHEDSMNTLDKRYRVEEKGWSSEKCIHNQQHFGECMYVGCGYTRISYRLLELHDCQPDEIHMTIPPGVLVVTLGTIHENNKRFSGPWSMEWSSELSAGGRYCPKNVDRDQRKREAAQYKC
ncbi:hypothetical protein ALC53_02567, partial [Atta colombica]